MVVKNYILVTIISLALGSGVRGAQGDRLTIDGSSAESFAKSFLEIKQALPAFQQKTFEEAFITLMFQMLVRHKKGLDAVRQVFNGKTGNEVIEASTKAGPGIKTWILEKEEVNRIAWESAAKQGDPFAQLTMGMLYDAGIRVPQDYKEAERWYYLAADQGLSVAQYALGLLYAKQKNYIQAHMWINLAAAAQGNQYAYTLVQENPNPARERADLAALMTPKELAKAHQLSREWKAQHNTRKNFFDYSFFSLLKLKPYYSMHSMKVESNKIFLKLLLDEQISQPSTTITPSIKLPPSELDQRIAKLTIPDVAPVESIKQRLELLEMQATGNPGRSTSKPSPGKNRYLAMVEDAIDGQWVAPPLLASTPLVIMKFRISRSGEISRIHIAESSGHAHYDSAAQRAVQAINPLPPFPSDISESFFDVQYRFIKD